MTVVYDLTKGSVGRLKSISDGIAWKTSMASLSQASSGICHKAFRFTVPSLLYVPPQLTVMAGFTGSVTAEK